MLKRLVAAFFFVLICLNGFTVCAENDVFYIGREADLSILEEYPDATFYLKCNIVFSKVSDVLFPDEEKPFSGTLDGKGYSLSFFRIETDGEVAAFIGYNSGKISNLCFTNASVIGKGANAVVGGITAYNNGVIENCSFEGKIISNDITLTGMEMAGVNNGKILNGTKDDDSEILQSSTAASTQAISVKTETSSEPQPSSSSEFVIDYNNSTSIISSDSSVETSHIKETSSKSASKKSSSSSKESSSSENTVSDRPTTEDISTLSVFYGGDEKENNILSVVLLGLCVAAIFFACGFAIYKEIENKKKK